MEENVCATGGHLPLHTHEKKSHTETFKHFWHFWGTIRGLEKHIEANKGGTPIQKESKYANIIAETFMLNTKLEKK